MKRQRPPPSSSLLQFFLRSSQLLSLNIALAHILLLHLHVFLCNCCADLKFQSLKNGINPTIKSFCKNSNLLLLLSKLLHWVSLVLLPTTSLRIVQLNSNWVSTGGTQSLGQLDALVLTTAQNVLRV